MQDKDLLRIHSYLWELEQPYLLIRIPTRIWYTCTHPTAIGNLNQHSLSSLRKEDLIFQIWGCYQPPKDIQTFRVQRWCFGSDVYPGTQPDPVLLTNAVQESLVLLRTYADTICTPYC